MTGFMRAVPEYFSARALTPDLLTQVLVRRLSCAPTARQMDRGGQL
jgi:hypothetical protein